MNVVNHYHKGKKAEGTYNEIIFLTDVRADFEP